LIEPAPITGGGEDMPETWRLTFQWRPTDIIDVPDFEDAQIDTQEAAAQFTEDIDSEEEDDSADENESED